LRGEGVAVVEARTFSKIYGLAGLRIGYAVAEANISRLLNRVRPPFNTSSIAQAAALAALQDAAWVDASAQANRLGRAQLLEGLKQLGWKASGQHANFILLHTADGAALTERLAQAGIIVRDLAGYRLPQLVRVSIGTTEQNRRFLEAMRGLSPSPLMDVA
jgi:histidinol-phosphate aminotransferase